MTGPCTLSSDDLTDLFEPLRGYRRVVLAVSGGSDSMALLHLAATWARKAGHDGPHLIAATVDHGLRKGSAADAECVAAEARSLGLEAHVLTWRGEKPAQSVQERAREMRYRLLCQLAAAGPVPAAIVTAHTQDDQGETVLMRLARGSGPDGLSGMRPVRPLGDCDGVFLLRPLLGIRRQDLRSYLETWKIAWLEDPSNENPQFERVRIRQLGEATASLGLSPPKLALAARRQRRAVDALEAATDELQRAALDLHGGAFASVDGRLFADAAEELRVRLMSRVLAMFGGASPRAELAQIERLVAGMEREGALRATLGGCEVRSCRKAFRVFRERGRAGFSMLELGTGDEAVWDDRFHISVAAAPARVIVRAFDKQAKDAMQNGWTRSFPPVRAAATLPAVWVGDVLVGVGGLPAELLPPAGDRAVHVATHFIHARVPCRS